MTQDGTDPDAQQAADDRTPRLGDVRTGPLRRWTLSLAIVLAVLALFLWLVADVLVAGLLGVVIAVYLHPLTDRIEETVGRRWLAATVALLVIAVPVLAIVTYGYSELSGASTYLTENTEEVSSRIAESLQRLPFVHDIEEPVQKGLDSVTDWAKELPGRLQAALPGLLVMLSIFFATVYYVLTDREKIVTWLRETIPESYAPLTESLERNLGGVLHGTIDAVFLTQAMKAGVVLGLNLALGVPLPFTLAALAFAIGLFPVLGTWTVYVPAAAYLMVFEQSPVRAGLMVGLGFLLSTIFLSMWVRPKLGSDRSEVLDFYWMFVGLVAGAYAFGARGVILGPLLVGAVKAAVETFRAPDAWIPEEHDDEDGQEADLLTGEELETADG